MGQVSESKMIFNFDSEDENLFWIEKSSLYEKFENKKIRSVEFIAEHDSRLVFLEAKKSFSKPGNTEDFEKNIEEIYEKFFDSFNLFLAIFLDRPLNYTKDSLKELQNFDFSSKEIKFCLVINSFEIPWLEPISDGLKTHPVLSRLCKCFSIDILVINEMQAKSFGLVREIQ